MIDVDKLLSKYEKRAVKRLKYVFVVAPGRSGSTLVQTVLNSIDGWKILGENWGSLQGLIASFNGTQITRIHELAEVPHNHPWFGSTDVEVNDYVTSLASTFTRHVLRPDRSTRVIGLKEIRWEWQDLTQNLRDTQTIFPNARFVLNVRNPADVAKSGWWRESEDSINQVSGIVQAIENTSQELREDSFLLRYEEYTSDAASLRALFEWLGEVWDETRIREILAHKLSH